MNFWIFVNNDACEDYYRMCLLVYNNWAGQMRQSQPSLAVV